MRKIKITALLLAVLMVVTAFAGCASKSTVTNLDNKVNDLDNKIQEQADALSDIQTSLKDISDALANQGSSTELDDIKADVEANKQSVSDILAAIEDLKEAVAGATGSNEDVKKAISQAGAKIDALKGAYEDDKANYRTEDLAAIREILGDAQATISACVEVAAVSAALADMETKLAAYKSVNGALYDYVVELKGNITDDSAAKVEEAYKALVAAAKFYAAGYNAEALVEYKVEDEKVNLVAEIQTLKTLQENELPKIKARAVELVAKIDEAAAEYDETALYDLLGVYRAWERDAKKLSVKNVELVTNYEKLNAALAAAQNVQSALKAFESASWEYPSVIADSFGLNTGIFGDYIALEEGRALFAYPTKSALNHIILGRVVDIYDDADERLADFKAEYELNDAALEYIVETSMEDEFFLEKYESNKALAKAFAAEYDKLVADGGIFSNIEALNTKSLNATVSLALAQEYIKNANDINAWRDALVAAYKAEYAADEDAEDTREVNLTAYKSLLEYNFVLMAYVAELGHQNLNAPATTCPCCQDNAYFVHTPAIGGFLKNVAAPAVVNGVAMDAFYLGLYDFECANNDKLKNFLTVIFPEALAYANVINGRIADFKQHQAESIVILSEKIGGYHYRIGNELLATDQAAIKEAMINGGEPTTIAEFIAKYNRPEAGYDLSGLLNTDAYNEIFDTIVKEVADAKAALKNLMTTYLELLDGYTDVVVTMENAEDILELEPLHKKWLQLGRIDMEEAIVKKANAAIKEYDLVYITNPYVADENRQAFYYTILNPDEYSKTVYNANAMYETGEIVRLVYEARTLIDEAAAVESLYKAVEIYDKAGALTFQNMKNAGRDVAKALGGEGARLNTFGTLTTTGGGTSYTSTLKAIEFDAATTAFVEKSYTGTGASKEASLTALANTVLAKVYGPLQIVGINVGEWNDSLSEYLFEDSVNSLKYVVATTDYEELKGELNGKIIPAYLAPMLAMYLEAKFEINNMGMEYEPIEAAKKSFATEGSAYGYSYIHAMSFVRLNIAWYLSDTSLEVSAFSNAKNYPELRRAVESFIMMEIIDFDNNNINKEMTFGGGDYTWLAKTYDIRVRDFFDNNYYVLDGIFDHDGDTVGYDWINFVGFRANETDFYDATLRQFYVPGLVGETDLLRNYPVVIDNEILELAYQLDWADDDYYDEHGIDIESLKVDGLNIFMPQDDCDHRNASDIDVVDVLITVPGGVLRAVVVNVGCDICGELVKENEVIYVTPGVDADYYDNGQVGEVDEGDEVVFDYTINGVSGTMYVVLTNGEWVEQ